MRRTLISNHLAFWLSAAVLTTSLMILFFGWGFGVHWLVRPAPDANALVPGSALVLAHLSFASLPISSRRGSLAQIGAVIAALAFVTVVGLPSWVARTEADGWLLFPPNDSDGFSVASQAGAMMAAIAPLVRLRVFHRFAGVAVTTSFLGMVYFLLAAALIAFFPLEIDSIPMLHFLSLHTSALFTVLFAAQFLVQVSVDPLPIEDDDSISV